MSAMVKWNTADKPGSNSRPGTVPISPTYPRLYRKYPGLWTVFGFSQTVSNQRRLDERSETECALDQSWRI